VHQLHQAAPLLGQLTCAVGVSGAEAAAGACQEAVLVDRALGAANVGGVLPSHATTDRDVNRLRKEVGVVRGRHLYSMCMFMVSSTAVRLQETNGVSLSVELKRRVPIQVLSLSAVSGAYFQPLGQSSQQQHTKTHGSQKPRQEKAYATNVGEQIADLREWPFHDQADHATPL
jgi:hypothetical protein